MKIGLADVDGHNFPNLALMKISAHHKQRGDTIDRWFGLGSYNRVYKSKVFDFTPDIETIIMADEIIEGGTGYDLKTALPEEIEHSFPDYGLYGITDTAYGFLTRGCPRGCKFCIVGKKEGLCSRKVADLSEFWGAQKNIKLLDPNLLAATEAEPLLEQLAKSRAHVDFTQGLDVRLLDKARAALIKNIRVKLIHFAWDNPKQDLTKQFQKAKEWLGYDERKLIVYVLTNFNSTHEEDLRRVYTLHELGFNPYIMIFDKGSAPRETRLLQRWVNNRIIFKTCKRFEDYDPKKG